VLRLTNNNDRLQNFKKRQFMTKNTDSSNKTWSKRTFQIPWWVYLLFAVCSYCILQYILPSMFAGQQELENYIQMAQKAAPIIAIAFLLPAAHALYQNDKPSAASPDLDENKRT